MQLTQITPDPSLYSVSDVFSSSICNQLNNIDWLSLPQMKVGDSNRLNLVLPSNLDREIKQHALDVLFPTIENYLKIKFTNSHLFSFICWYNTVDYWSGIHIDGTIPSTMQIFWEPVLSPDWGTTFYKSKNIDDVLHYFPSIQNTGYFTLCKTAQHKLWHGTTKPLSPGVLRISFMFVLDDYATL